MSSRFFRFNDLNEPSFYILVVYLPGFIFRDSFVLIFTWESLVLGFETFNFYFAIDCPEDGAFVWDRLDSRQVGWMTNCLPDCLPCVN